MIKIQTRKKHSHFNYYSLFETIKMKKTEPFFETSYKKHQKIMRLKFSGVSTCRLWSIPHKICWFLLILT